MHNFTFPPNCTRVPFFLTSSLILAVFQVFLIVAILMHVRCFLIVVFICIFLIISGMKHLSYACWPFVCHLWRSVYSSLLCIICIFNVVVDTWFVNIFSCLVDCPLALLTVSFGTHKILMFWCSPICLVLLLLPMFLVLFSGNTCQVQCHKAFSYVYFSFGSYL